MVWGDAVGRVRGEGDGGIDNDGWVLRPIWCDVWTLGCPTHTAKPLGRIIAKWVVVPSPIGIQYNACVVWVCVWCVVCLMLHVWCGWVVGPC